MKKANALVVLLVLIPIILVTQCKSKEYPPDYKTTTPTPAIMILQSPSSIR